MTSPLYDRLRKQRLTDMAWALVVPIAIALALIVDTTYGTSFAVGAALGWAVVVNYRINRLQRRIATLSVIGLMPLALIGAADKPPADRSEASPIH